MLTKRNGGPRPTLSVVGQAVNLGEGDAGRGGAEWLEAHLVLETQRRTDKAGCHAFRELPPDKWRGVAGNRAEV